MEMFVTYTCREYDPSKVRKRYIRATFTAGVYQYIEVGDDRRWDMRQANVNGIELPTEIKKKADALLGQAFGYVELPS